MPLPSKTQALAVASFFAAVGLTSPATAQANCETYGKLALQQQKENVDNKCGFSGAPWSSDLKAHIAWCAGVGPDQWKSELKSRQQQLDTCKAK